MLFWYSNGDHTNAHKRHVHSRPTCPRLKGGVARNRTTDVVADTVPRYPPCSFCWPVKRRDAYKPWCATCESWRACPHNGGVPVRTARGVTYVWPDREGFHQPLGNRSNQV